jgi:hypothetical protein
MDRSIFREEGRQWWLLTSTSGVDRVTRSLLFLAGNFVGVNTPVNGRDTEGILKRMVKDGDVTPNASVHFEERKSVNANAVGMAVV